MKKEKLIKKIQQLLDDLGTRSINVYELDTETQIGLGVVKQVPKTLWPSGVKVKPVRPGQLAIDIDFAGSCIKMRHIADSMKKLPIWKKRAQ